MELSVINANKISSKPVTIGGETILQQLLILLSGTFFGIVLVKSDIASWFRIQKMFYFEEAHMFLVLGTATVVGAISLFLIKKFHLKTIQGAEIKLKGKKFQKGIIIGGVIFGMGWAVATCPGPIYAQIGSGEYISLVTLAGTVVGAYLYALLQSKLPH